MISIRFGVSSTAIVYSPVTLPQGRAKSSTIWLPIGSGTTMKTIGIFVVACVMTMAAGRVTVASTAGLSTASSSAFCLNRTGSSFGKRCLRWVKNGKTHNEQMFSVVHPTTDIGTTEGIKQQLFSLTPGILESRHGVHGGKVRVNRSRITSPRPLALLVCRKRCDNLRSD